MLPIGIPSGFDESAAFWWWNYSTEHDAPKDWCIKNMEDDFLSKLGEEAVSFTIAIQPEVHHDWTIHPEAEC